MSQLASRSGVFRGKTDQTQYATGAATSIGATLLSGVKKGWPGMRHKVTGKNLVQIFGVSSKNQQDYLQLWGFLQVAKEAEVVRVAPADAKYPLVQSLYHNASLINQGLTYQAKKAGVSAVSVELVAPAVDTALSVAVTGNDITVTLGYSGGAVTSTAAQVKAALEANLAAMDLIGLSGTGAVPLVALAKTTLTGGAVPQWETAASTFSSKPEEVVIGTGYGLLLFVRDGSDGKGLGFKITGLNLTKQQFTLEVYQKNADGTWPLKPFESNLVSVASSGANSKNGDGETIFIESRLVEKGSILGAKVRVGIDLENEVAATPAQVEFVGGTEGILANLVDQDYLNALDILKTGTGTLFFAAGFTSATVIDKFGAVALEIGAHAFADVPFSNTPVTAITFKQSLAANPNLSIYYNALRCDDPLHGGRTLVGHAGNAAAACARCDFDSDLITARAPAGERFGRVDRWKNVELVHDLAAEDLNDLADARINVAIPNTNPNLGPVMFNDQWNLYGEPSEFERIHVQRTIEYINRSLAKALSGVVHDDNVTTFDKVERIGREILGPMQTAGMLVVSKKGEPPWTLVHGEDPTQPGVYLVTPKVSIVRSMRQIDLNTHSI